MDLDKIRRDIEKQRADAVERREKLARHVNHRDEPLPPDFAEQAQERGNDEAMVALSNELDAMIDDCDKALKRIDDGRYGTCAECGEPINELRLKALPAVSLCLDCAE
jgi:RNA polymerase-binding transcription factor DksA